ncbi:MAG: hypothetical protein ACHQ53_02855 [Polyangiales bacterium]
MSDEQNRIANEEAYWNAPRLFTAGLVFLAICVVVIYAMATFAFSNVVG